MIFYRKTRNTTTGVDTLFITDVMTGRSISCSDDEIIPELMELVGNPSNSFDAIKSVVDEKGRSKPDAKARMQFIRDKYGLTLNKDGSVSTREGFTFPAGSASILSSIRSEKDMPRVMRFVKRVMSNPRPYTHKALSRWVSVNPELEILNDGRVLGYRAVFGPEYLSWHSGYGVVNGIPMNSQLSNKPGNIIEFPVEVTDHSSTACSIGLHVGTLLYAQRFSSVHPYGRIVKVAFAPEDVISRIGDVEQEKVRVSKMEILDDYKGQ